MALKKNKNTGATKFKKKIDKNEYNNYISKKRKGEKTWLKRKKRESNNKATIKKSRKKKIGKKEYIKKEPRKNTHNWTPKSKIKKKYNFVWRKSEGKENWNKEKTTKHLK